MHARNRTWALGSDPAERCRQRTLPVEGGDGSTLSLDFTTGVLDPRLTFTRSTSGTYIGSDGLVKTMAAAPTNDPTKARFDYDPTTLAPRGLLIEGSANNLATNSNLQAGWLGGTNTTVTANTTEVTSPDGTNNAAKIALTNTGYCSRFESITGLANATTYTFSYWIRGTAGNQQRVYSVTQGTDLVTQSNLTYTSTGWTRVQITFTSGATNNNVYLYVASRPSGTVNDVIYVYGCQLETGTGASSLIPTGASTGSRAADRVSITSGVSAWAGANAANRSYVFDCTIQNFQLGTSDFPDMVTLADGANRDRHYFYNSSGSVRTYITGDYAGTADDWQTNTGGASATVPLRRKIGLAIQPGTVFRSVDGASESSITGSPATFAPTALYIGPMSELTADPGRRGSLLVRSFKYWPSTLPQTTLNAATAL